MKYNSNSLNIRQFKDFLKSSKFFFYLVFFKTLQQKKNRERRQDLTKLNYVILKINKVSLENIFSKSIFKNIRFFFGNSTSLVFTKIKNRQKHFSEHVLREIINNNNSIKNFMIFSLILEKWVFQKHQLKNVLSFHFLVNIRCLYRTLLRKVALVYNFLFFKLVKNRNNVI